MGTMCQFAPTEIVGFWIPSRVTWGFHWQQPLYVISSSERIFVALHLIGVFVPLGEVFVEVQFSMTCRFYCSHLGSFARPKCWMQQNERIRTLQQATRAAHCMMPQHQRIRTLQTLRTLE